MNEAVQYDRKYGLQRQILIACVIGFLLSFAIVSYLNQRIARVIAQMERTYSSNRVLTGAQQELFSMEQDLTEYLSTRSELSLDSYYTHAEAWNRAVTGLNQSPSMNETAILEKNIVRLADSYQELADTAIRAKSERDLDTYQVVYAELAESYDYLNDLINTLNQRRLAENALSFDAFMNSARLTGGSNIFMLALIGGLDVALVLLLTKLARRDSQLRENALREQSIAAESRVKDAQLKYLQAQINPHFLFNTLNAGAQLAMMEDADRTYGYLHKVADFYRTVAGRDVGDTTLRQELETVNTYIYIINVRYGGAIGYREEVDGTLLSFAMPGMILQPIVENAVKHGLEAKEEGKRISLVAERREGRVVLRISDNGLGMEPQKIREILEAREEISESGEDPLRGVARGSGGVGLPNVLARLRMYYGTEDVLQIESGGPGQGTTFILNLPEGADHV